MRNNIKRTVIAALCLLILFTACSCGKTVKDVDGLMNEMLSFGFEDKANMIELEPEMISMKYPAMPNVNGRMILGSGATAEEFTVLEAKSEEDAAETEEAARAHISSQKERYSTYKPSELDKLNKAIVKRYGLYIVVCVCADTEAAQQVIDKYIG